MPPRRDDDVDWRPVDRSAGTRSSLPTMRVLTLAVGFVLAGAATLGVFLTDNPQHLRVSVVAVAWAFVLATFAAGRRQTDRVVAAGREAELRRAYEQELDREVAARREYELELENEMRRETEDSVRTELDALRSDIAALSSLREEVAGVSAMRGDLAALAALREEVARVASLRDDVAALTSLRGELGQLSELRADVGRLRAELMEQLASEMLVERITMRTQASRLPSEPVRLDGPGRALDAPGSWSDGAPPRELTGGWPAVRLDEPHETRQFEEARPAWDSASPAGNAWDPAPATTARPAVPPPWSAEPAPATSAVPLDEPPTWQRSDRPAPQPSRYSGDPGTPSPSPMDWLAARSLLDARPPVPSPSVPSPSVSAQPDRPRWDEPSHPWDDARTTERPAPAPASPPAPPTAAHGYPAATPSPQPPASPPMGSTTTGSLRVSEILAENGISPATGGRRRRRYRDDDTSDDVLSRVLGRN